MKIIYFILCALLLIGCTYYPEEVSSEGSHQGRVIDAATGEPIKDVVVLAVWYRISAGPAGEVRDYLESHETATDGNGLFLIPAPKKLAPMTQLSILIFKAEYESLGSLGAIRWASLKKDKLLREKVKWEGDMPIIPLRKLSMAERKRRLLPGRPWDVPDEKMPLLNKEWRKAKKTKLGPLEKED